MHTHTSITDLLEMTIGRFYHVLSALINVLDKQRRGS